MADLSLAHEGAADATLHVLRFTLRERINEPFALSLVRLMGSSLSRLAP